MNENGEVDSSTPISYGDLRISSDRRKGPCLFWVCIVYTLSRPALSGHERLSHHICELQFRWFLMWPRASMWQTSTPSSWPTADLLKGHRKAAGSLLPNVRARASAPATTPQSPPPPCQLAQRTRPPSQRRRSAQQRPSVLPLGSLLSSPASQPPQPRARCAPPPTLTPYGCHETQGRVCAGHSPARFTHPLIPARLRRRVETRRSAEGWRERCVQPETRDYREESRE